MRTFTHHERQQFWTVRRDGTSVITTTGKVGGKGRVMEKKHPSQIAAIAAMNTAIGKKCEDGYVATTVYETLPPLAPEGSALEQALVDDPDDLSAHMAYADWLSEQPDERLVARSELIRVQLALEGPSKTGPQRSALTRREKKLLAEQQRLFFGELRSWLLDDRRDDPFCDAPKWSWRRGWVSDLEVQGLSVPMAEAIGESPAMRLLRRLVLSLSGEAEPAFVGFAGAPYLTNVRELQVAANDATGVEDLIAQLPRVEEIWLSAQDVPLAPVFRLRNLEHLRSLSLSGVAEDFPLAELAKNTTLGRLETLFLAPSDLMPWKTTRNFGDARINLADVRALVRSKHLRSLTSLGVQRSDMGDKGIQAIIDSGILKRLHELDLSWGRITDEGARALAACPDTRNLKHLDLRRNRLTAAGRQALERAGILADVDSQQEAYADGSFDDSYLYAEDME